MGYNMVTTFFTPKQMKDQVGSRFSWLVMEFTAQKLALQDGYVGA